MFILKLRLYNRFKRVVASDHRVTIAPEIVVHGTSQAYSLIIRILILALIPYVRFYIKKSTKHTKQYKRDPRGPFKFRTQQCTTSCSKHFKFRSLFYLNVSPLAKSQGYLRMWSTTDRNRANSQMTIGRLQTN